VGEGKLLALAGIAGLLAGTWLYGWRESRPAPSIGEATGPIGVPPS
jgi:hypothetical protein